MIFKTRIIKPIAALKLSVKRRCLQLESHHVLVGELSIGLEGPALQSCLYISIIRAVLPFGMQKPASTLTTQHGRTITNDKAVVSSRLPERRTNHARSEISMKVRIDLYSISGTKAADFEP